jgi:glycosyltransferase involved in cell wall biosynthesis
MASFNTIQINANSMRTGPLVCICIPTFNAAETLAETISSILSQLYQGFILHIVDNASTDRTLEIADQFAALDKRVHVHRHQVNVGAEGNFTRCLQMMEGEFGAIFHADDVYHPGMLQSAVADLVSHPKVGVVFCESLDIGPSGSVIGSRLAPIAGRRSGSLSILNGQAVLSLVCKYGNIFICPSAVVRSAILRDEIREWDGARFKTSADLDVWLRIAQRHQVGIRHLSLMSYRVSAASHSFGLARVRTAEHDIFLVLDHWVNKSLGIIVNRRNVAMLRDRDGINRAINCVLKGDGPQAWRLWARSFRSPFLLRALLDKWHRPYRLVGFALLPFMFLIAMDPVRRLMYRLRFGNPERG